MHLRFPAESREPSYSTFLRSLFLAITIVLLVRPIAAQDPSKTEADTAVRLMLECQQLIAEGSPASLTKALDTCEAARVSLHSLNLPEGEGVVLVLIGYAHGQLDQNQKAVEKYEQALVLARAAGQPKLEAVTLLHLGLLQGKLGEWQKALDNFDKALPLFHKAGENQGEMVALAVLGSLHVQLGKPEEIISYYNKVLEILRATNSPEGEAAVLTAVGPLYAELGQPEKARETLERAVAVYRDLHFPRGEAAVLLTLGLLHSFELEIPKAIKYYEQALPIFRNEHERIGEGAALEGLCVSYISSHDYQKGFDYCAQARELLHATGDRQNEALVLRQIAIAERNRGNLTSAQTAIESAIVNVESLRTKVVNPGLRVSYFEGSQDYYDFYIDLLMHLHRQHPNEVYDGKALETSERSRARSLLDTLTEANADIRQGIDPSLLQREREIQRRLNASAQKQQLLSASHSDTQASAIAEEIETLIKSLQQVETEIRQTSPRYAALMQPQPLTLKAIQTAVLDADTLLLEYSLGEERSYLWLVTTNSITSHELPKRSEIETAARRYYELLNARNLRVKNETNEQRERRIAQADGEMPLAAEALSRLVLAPVAGRLGNKRLIIVADGALHFVPFGVLPVIASGGASDIMRARRVTRPLIIDHEIVNLPSASTLAVVRKEVAGRQIAPKSLVALADPVFMKNDERVKAPNKSVAGDENTNDRQLVKAAAEDTGVANEGLYVPRLPGTRKEAEQIVVMVPAQDRWLALDFAASRDTVTSAELGQYRYVHFSTHGFLNSVHPELSGVVFSLVNERGEAQDGFLRAHELFNLKLPAEVVVLSACQTGLGKTIKGEGLVSLTRGFMYAGAPRVVVSLWAVSDLGTTELMVRFYQGMLKEGMRPAAALRAAQISLMNDKRFESPYYWAPFTLQGEWR